MDNEYNYYKPEEPNGEENRQEEKSGEVNFVLKPTPEQTEEKTEQRKENAAGVESSQGVYQGFQSGEQQGHQAGAHPDSHPRYGGPGMGAPGAGAKNSPKRPGKPKKKHTTAIKVAACVGFAVLFGVVASGTYQASNFIVEKILGEDTTSTNTNKEVETTKVNKSKSMITSDVTEIVDETMPSVVSITNMSVQEVQSFFGGRMQQEVQSSGSGVIVGKNDSELLILTNNHVVENNQTLTVSFVDNESVEAVIKGADSARDVAVIAVKLDEIKDSTMDEIAIATIGDSSSLQVGEPVIAIGNALGFGQSVTTGVVSAKDRELIGFEGKLIQTDAAINPGNSGGALMNANGEVIGINTAKITESIQEGAEGMGFAIQISDIEELLENLMNKETRTKVSEAERGYLGITGVDVNEETAKAYNMPETGVFVSEVQDGSGADKAGIIQGSIITEFEDVRIDSMSGLQEQLQYYKSGETVKLTLMVPENKGNYEEVTVEVTLTSASKLK